MHTPSGRFQTSTRLCLSISDFHPKSFNPAWSVSTILIGLLSFMNSEEMTAGSLSASKQERKWHAARSRWWNSTGGGSAGAKRPVAGNVISGSKGSSNNNIKAGDGGRKFRDEWEEIDSENWAWMEEVGVDPATGRVLEQPVTAENVDGGALQKQQECGPEIARLRDVLGGGTGTSLGQAAREAGEGWVGRWKWWLVAGFVVYVVATRVVWPSQI